MKQKFIIITLVLSLFAIGCSHKEKKIVTRTSLTLNLQEGDPPSLNPYLGVDLRSRCLFLNLFEPLMRRSVGGDLCQAAAEKIEINSDCTKYIFHLRPHSWSNGEPVTALHFEQAWRFALNPTSPCLRPDLFYPIKNAEKVKKGELPLESLGISCLDNKTLVVELEHPTPYFLELTATSFFLPLYAPSSEEPLYFNGPYTVGEHKPDESLTFCKNKFYWDANSVEIDEIKLLMIKDPMTALALFEKGELDIVGDPFSTIPFDAIPSLKNSSRIESKIVSRIFYLLLNTESAPLNNTTFRNALSLSIDRESFTKHLFFGQLPTISHLPLPLSMLDSQEIANKKNKDCVALFEKALEEMDLTRETCPVLTLSYAELTGQKHMAEFVQAEWRRILGIEVKLKCCEWNVHSADLKRKNYQIGALHLTTLYQDPMFYFDLFRDKNSPTNYCRWESQDFKNHLYESEHCDNHENRKICLRDAERLLLEEMPAIPIFTQNFQYLKQVDVDVDLTDLGIYEFKNARKKS